MGRYVKESALANLHKYKYNSVDKSLLSKHILNPFWNWFVTLWPKTVAPNTITLLGLSIVGFNFLTLLFFDPGYLTSHDGAQQQPPNWVYYTWSAGLFAYQAFDAIDGKQARRTGMAGPLGEMFDHGCDAINTTLGGILASRALNLGRSWWTVSSMIAALATFYLTTWEEFHTGQLYLGRFSGPVEGIIMLVGMFAATGYLGPEFWDTGILTITGLDKIPAIASVVPNLGLNITMMLFGVLSLALNIKSSYMNVRRVMRSQNKSPLRPLLFLLPFAVSVLLNVAWLIRPVDAFTSGHSSNAKATSPPQTKLAEEDFTLHGRFAPIESAIMHSSLFIPFICAWGLQFAHQVGRMILAHVTSQSFPWFDGMWVWSVLGAVDANMPLLAGRPPFIQSTQERTAIFVYATLAIALVSYGRFCTLVIQDITNYLGIACFKTQKKDPKDGKWKDASEVPVAATGPGKKQ